jgi:hypothetical protein
VPLKAAKGRKQQSKDLVPLVEQVPATPRGVGTKQQKQKQLSNLTCQKQKQANRGYN